MYKKFAYSLTLGLAILSFQATAHEIKTTAPQKNHAHHQEQIFPSKADIQAHTILTVETILDVYNQAKEGDSDAQAALATGYETGSIGNLPNYDEAARWFKKSAKQDNGLALFSLSRLYNRGLGVERNYEKATKLAQQAIPIMLKKIKDEPNKHNLYYWRLGQAYFWGVKDLSHKKGKWIVKPDFERAFQYFHKAAELGDFHSMMNVMLMYHQGIGTTKDEAQSFDWAKYLASLNFAAAQYKTGLDYLNGEGVEKNKKKAIEYLEQSALVNYFPALSELITLSQDGDKTDINIISQTWIEAYQKVQDKLMANPFYSAMTHGGL